MNRKIKEKVRKILLNRLNVNQNFLAIEEFINTSFSQEGEDMILSSFLNTESGFYVDIGAHHPMRFSNTYRFYLRGWRGINVDPMPGSMILFDKLRPNDINLELGVSEVKDSLNYYMFNETALNTFSQEEAEKKNKDPYKIIEVKKIQTHTLAEILDTHLPANTIIDFFDIDVEGFDLAVLRSNNWSKYRPKMILAETLNRDFNTIENDELYKFLTNIGYKLVAKTSKTAIFNDDK